MAFLPLREVPLPTATAALYDRWLASVEEALAHPDCDRDDLCRRILTDLYYPQYAGVEPETLPAALQVALAQLDPRNVTLEPEYYREIDLSRWARVKPLLWLWEMFDKSPLGENVHAGIKFRRILAKRIFRKCGRNFKAFQFVKFSFGYNLEVGDDVVIHRCVLLDDRGGIRLGDRVSVSDFANVYSHTHDIVDAREIHTPVTVIGADVRVTYHATVLAGVHLAEDSILGAMALATRDTKPHHVHVGSPAKAVKEKPAGTHASKAAPPTRDPLAAAAERGEEPTRPRESSES